MAHPRRPERFFSPKCEDVLHIRRTEARVLRLFCLSRIGSDSKGKYFVHNEKIIKLAFIIAFVTVVQCARLIHGIYYVSNTQLTSISVFGLSVSAILMTVQFVSAIVSVASPKTEEILACYDNLQEIDQLLFMSKYYAHKKDKRECHRAFFGVTALRFLTKLTETILWTAFYGLTVISVSVDAFFALPVDLHTMDYFTWLVVLRSRLVRLQQTTSEYATGEAGALLDRRYERGARGEPGRLPHAVDNFALCYYLLFDQICRLNKRFGFQAMLMQLKNLLFTISVMHSTIHSLKNGPLERVSLLYLAAVLLSVIYSLQDIAMLCLGLRHIMSFRKYTARMVITAEKGAADRSADEAQRVRWAKLVSLCRRRPAVFTAGTFFKLDYSLLASMLGAMVTYNITLIQFDQPRMNSTATTLNNTQ